MIPPRSVGPSSGTPASADAAMQSLARRMQERWWRYLRQRQASLSERDLMLTIDQVRSPGVPSRAPDPLAPDAMPAPRADPDGERERLRRAIEQERAEAEARLRAEREAPRLRVLDRARSLGLGPLVDHGRELADLVEDFVSLVDGGVRLVREQWTAGSLHGQLATDLDPLPAAVVQELSRQYYRLVGRARRAGMRLTPADVREIGARFAESLRSQLGDQVEDIEVICEGETFDAETCALADAAQALGPRRAVEPLTFAVGARGSRHFRKALVVPDRDGEAEA